MNTLMDRISTVKSPAQEATANEPDQETLELIFEEIEETLLKRAASSPRAQAILNKVLTSGVPLREVSRLIFQGKKFAEIISILDAKRRKADEAAIVVTRDPHWACPVCG